jgi:hypothetical protein
LPGHGWEKVAAFVFGTSFVVALLALAVLFPEPTPFQYQVFRIVLTLACAGVAAVIPGFLALRTDTAGLLIRAGGALAVFVLVYLQNPAQLVVPEVPAPPKPASAPQPLAGAIWNEANEPLPGVRVTLPAFDLSMTTNALGRFRFRVTAPTQATVELIARKAGYHTHDQYATLGNTQLSFTLRKTP